jgi:hypothetical protein
MSDVHDNDTIEELLVRSGDHLMERTAQYREQPVRASAQHDAARPRFRRVLVGSAAVATLCVAALAGSFIGGTSSGKVDVAQAAWSAVPAIPTAEQVTKVRNDCGISANQLATLESVPPASIPDYMLEPSLVDVRGTTTTAVYFTWTGATLCTGFADGSMDINQIPMIRPNEIAWQKPASVEVVREDMTATLIVGFLPPNQTGTDPNSTQESDTITVTQWEAYIEGPGVERTKASVSPSMERFVAWVPVTGNWTVTFVNTTTGEKRVAANVMTDNSVPPWVLSPVTTVAFSPND